ncbi:hypothetical protein [Robertkochia sediminum]|uniref:hypothetical protein n=1 Tax=Robertkochia sediminum TaxID=2785326 RepID=UPI0019328A07|nr:hypothetical protein [Robertkochia sediminum]MBL7473492.1 hypothetical protein [Robertkochia sediminum]
MKKIIKRILVFLLFVLLLGGVAYFVYNEPLPQGEKGPAAEALANKMLKAVNAVNYNKTRFMEWDFNGIHRYKWDRQKQIAEVFWDENRVVLNLNDYAKSQVYRNGVRIHDEENHAIIADAVDYFNNDSFWLVAPFKVFDKGVERRLVKTEEYGDALLVTYTSGGSTPGDSYLWLLDDKGFPVAFKMWVRIIPVGGVKAGWKQWKVTETATYLPTGHKLLFFNLKLNDVRAYGTIE